MVSMVTRRRRCYDLWPPRRRWKLFTKLWFVFNSSKFVMNNYYGLNLTRKCMCDYPIKVVIGLGENVTLDKTPWTPSQATMDRTRYGKSVCIRFGRWKHRFSIQAIILNWQTIVCQWTLTIVELNPSIRNWIDRQTDVNCRLKKNDLFLYRLLRLTIVLVLYSLYGQNCCCVVYFIYYVRICVCVGCRQKGFEWAKLKKCWIRGGKQAKCQIPNRRFICPTRKYQSGSDNLHVEWHFFCVLFTEGEMSVSWFYFLLCVCTLMGWYRPS